MIDFRYHLISIIAVLLALSIGVVLGSGLIGEPLLDDIQNNVDELQEQVDRRQEQISALNDRLDAEQAFADGAEPYLLSRALDNVEVVVIELDGSSGEMVERVLAGVGEAGGSVVTRIELREKLALADQLDRDELGLAIGSVVTDDPEELRREAAETIGQRAAAAAQQSGVAPVASVRLDALLEDLEESGFVEVTSEGDERAVPFGAAFLILGGSEEPDRYEAAGLTTPLAVALGADAAPVLLGETADSVWNMIPSLLEDGDARDAAASAEAVERTAGRVAAILGLSRAIDGEVGHYGTGSDADSVLPAPTPAG